MKKILVPIDFSECSEFALNYALNIAKGTNTVLHLLHIVELDYSFSGGDAGGAKLSLLEVKDKPANQLKDVFVKANELLQELAGNFPKEIKLVTEVRDGDLIGELISYGEENEIDMLVMGSHGERGVNTMILGSNAQKVLRYSTIPVVVVKEDSKEINFDRIVYSSDFKEKEMNDSINYVKNIADYYNSKIHLLYINTPNKFEDSDVVDYRIEDVISKFKIDDASYSTFNSSWIEEGIAKYCKIHSPDLLVINTHGFKGLKKLFHHSIAESIANNVKVPVMIINKA